MSHEMSMEAIKKHNFGKFNSEVSDSDKCILCGKIADDIYEKVIMTCEAIPEKMPEYWETNFFKQMWKDWESNAPYKV